MSYFKKIKNENGFSLIEMVIATALFAVIILITVGIFQSVIEGQRSAVAAQLTQETMRYVFEMMSKEIRLAANYVGASGTKDCNAIFGFVPDTNLRIYNKSTSATSEVLYFVNKNDECVSYYINSNDQLEVRREGDFLAVTADELVISKLVFDISDNSPTGVRTVFPWVTIRLESKVKVGKEYHNQPLIMQTTVSSRRYQ